MNIEKNKVVSLSYELRTSLEGEIVEKVENEQPLSFLFGTGSMLEKFEGNLLGLKSGEKFEFKLDYQDAYGAYTKEAIVEIPKDAFKIDGKIEEGLLEMDNIIPLQDNQGNRFNGKVINLSDSMVTMDLNHPLADKDLYFKGEVVEVREASEEELSHGHIHHEHHHHHEDHECTNCGKH